MLLIGAGGFLGGELQRAAAAAGLRVIAPARKPAGEGPACELLDPDSLVECLASVRPELVVNLAGSASVGASWEDPAASFAVNATGVLHLLEAVAQQAPEAHVLCVSSAQVYGQPAAGGECFTEDSPLLPLTPYGASKLAMEAIAGQYSRGRGLRIAIARLFNQLGPGQPPSQVGSEFAREIAAAEATGAQRARILLRSPGSARDFTDLRDTGAALLEISKRELSGTFNVGSGRAVALDTLIELLAAMTALAVEVEPAADRPVPAAPSSSCGDPSRLHEASGWAPQIPLEQSLGELLDWWRRELPPA